jgi:hypothetical protein
MFAGVMLLLPVGGWSLAASISQPPPEFAATIIRSGHTQVVTHTRVVKKVVRGRVIRLKGGTRVILVSRVVIHNLKCHPTRRHHCVRRVVVPAHRIPLRAATIHQAVAVAAPLVPVTVVLTDFVTETLPPQTVTQTDTATVTETAPTITVTVTVPSLP